MRPSFQPRLINDPFSDPGLYIPFLYEKRALLFDFGQLHSLSTRDLLKITHVFVTHTHMDHFIGFDTLLRVFLGREKELHLFGPSGFFAHVEGKLAGYTWNLVNEYQTNFMLRVTEVYPEKTLTRIYVCKDRFEPQRQQIREPFAGILWKEPSFYVEATILDHRIPCLGLSLVENFYVNIIKEGLKRLGLAPGSWLSEFKQALYRRTDPGAVFEVSYPGGPYKKKFKLGNLTEQIARITPGQKITYITDVVYSDANRAKILELARESDHLFIEAAFLDKDRDLAQKKYHLTARQAGELAARSGARQFKIFHFSPRYADQNNLLYEEANEAYQLYS